ncbi:MAG: site-specific integrase [Methylacidiphilales bacterium]|nr:site-specific integrase [Candidatus Methylacidiphilales bacterium]
MSLRTPLMEVAKERAHDVARGLAARAAAKAAADKGRMTVGDCVLLFEEKVQAGWSFRGRGNRNRSRNRPSTSHMRMQTLKALLKSWPELRFLDVRKVTPLDCERWGDRYCMQISPARFNSTLDTLRYVFEEAVQAKVRIDNPAQNVGRCTVRPKQVTLPNSRQFQDFIARIRSAGAWCSRDCADHVQFLAYTGARKNEAAHVEWRDVDLCGETIHLRVTKNGLPRRVPMIPAAKELLQRMRSQRAREALTVRVLRVRESQRAMTHAAAKIGMTRITHHDLRHLYATVCIESGVDIPTVARWMGHLDGGALAMKTYGHLRDEHSKLSAQKVSFAINPDVEEGKITPFPFPATA